VVEYVDFEDLPGPDEIARHGDVAQQFSF